MQKYQKKFLFPATMLPCHTNISIGKDGKAMNLTQNIFLAALRALPTYDPKRATFRKKRNISIIYGNAPLC